jgi:hypothetical protein
LNAIALICRGYRREQSSFQLSSRSLNSHIVRCFSLSVVSTPACFGRRAAAADIWSTSRHLIEVDFLALEVVEAASVGAGPTSTTSTSTTTTITEAATTTTAKAATAAITETTSAAPTTKATATTTSATITTSVLRARLAVVETHGAVVHITTLHGLESSCSFIDRREGDIAVALGVAGLVVGGDSDTKDSAVWFECVRDRLLIGFEGEIANEECIGRLADLVSTCLATSVLALVVAWFGVGEVNVQGTIVELGSCLTLVRLLGISSVLEVDVAIAICR